MMNEKRREDMARRIAALGRYRAIAGATILELGADKDGISAKMLADAGARRVISTNLDDDWRGNVDGVIERQRLDARAIPEAFESGSIDIVFGVAVLEHIDGLDAFFSGVRHALSAGGLLYVHGGPIWTSAIGHHLSFTGEAKHYRFSNPQTNPIRAWTHLIFDKQSLAEDMIARSIPASDAQGIAAEVYESDAVNRVGYRSICRAFDGSGLNLIERLDNKFAMPPDDLLAAIERGKWAGEERYDVSGVTFVARP